MKLKDTQSDSDDIAITGISGRFPKSNNMQEFSNNLYNKIDMADESEGRWKHFHPEVPKRTGKINNLNKFDAGFFSINNRLANCTDPQTRMLLEHSYEAILDSGLSPQTLIGSRTGVFIGCSYSDSKDAFIFTIPTKNGDAITGNANHYIANRLSQALQLCGPSMIVDTACSSSAYALDIAFKHIKSGACDAALVGGTQLVTNFSTTMDYHRLRILSSDGACRPFDKNASGFTRADTVCVAFLQKKKDSKRIYAELVYINTNNDGFKQEGSTFPSRHLQQHLFDECFLTLKMDPNQVGYIEAHSTGTFLGDAEEVAAIDGAFCKNRSKNPLLIGSLKSNMGHAEASSAIASIAKIVLTFENQLIPPNINLSELRSDIPAFAEGRIKVVTEAEPFYGNYVSLNSFGLGGANAHALFKGNFKSKINKGIPTDDMSRLICWSSRTKSAVNRIFTDVLSRTLDVEFVALLQNSQTVTSPANSFRGYGIFSYDKTTEKTVCFERDVKHFDNVKRPIVLLFSGIESQWTEMGSKLMQFPVFAKSIEECHEVLMLHGVNLKEILKSSSEKVSNSFVGFVATQIALTDLLKAVGIKPELIVSHSLGELGAAYADGCLTPEEVILMALEHGKAIDEIRELEKKNVFKKEIDSSTQRRYDGKTKEFLCKKLLSIIGTPRKRSHKWLSTAHPLTESDEYASADYFANSFLRPVLLTNIVSLLPPNAIVLEISADKSLKQILQRTMKDIVHFNLLQRGSEGDFINSIGKIFQNGIDIDTSKLYPAVEFPVSRGTPMISPLIEWDHSDDYFVPLMNTMEWFEKRSVMINISEKEFEFIQGHVIDGKIFFPGTGLLYLVWETLALMHGTVVDLMPVSFHEVNFMRATSLIKNQDVILTISVHRCSGRFEITEGLSVVAQGQIRKLESLKMTSVKTPERSDSFFLSESDFYKEMRLRGYFHRDLFRAIQESRDDGLVGKIKWNSNWTTFIDCLLQFQVLSSDTRMLVLPTKFKKLVINPMIHREILDKSEDGIVEMLICPYTRISQAGGVEIHDFEGSSMNRRVASGDAVLEVHKFIPHFSSKPTMSKIDAAKFCVQLSLENSPTMRFVSVEIDSNDGKDVFNEIIFQALLDLPTITSDMNYLTTRQLTLDHVNVNTKELSEFSNVNLIVKSNCFNDEEFMKTAKSVLHADGFVIAREPKDTTVQDKIPDTLQLVATIPFNDETVFLLQFLKQQTTPDQIVEITSNVDEWLETLQAALDKGTVLAFSQNEKLSGILGLVNCIRKENSRLKCVFIEDETAPPFDLKHPFYNRQLRLGLPVNAYKDNRWGTYRHLRLNKENELASRNDHCYASFSIKGDLSSINWFEGQFNIDNSLDDPDCIKVAYGAINFRDVMQASGKISFDFLTRIQQQCVLGFELSGVKNDGTRVMGLGKAGWFTTFNHAKNAILWDVPDHWSLEEAATVPLVYATIYLAFFAAVQIKKGESVLIHAGCGGVGLAALNVAFYYGLEVFTTCSTEEKRNFLLKEFPLLKPENIGNSRDTTFEQMVMVNTKGRGVNYVLNSLSEEKLLASVRCVAENGTFIEIGKFDILNKNKIDYSFCARKVNMKTVFMQATDLEQMGIEIIYNLMADDIARGVVKPLHTNVFEANEIQQAFRYLATGKHIGKVLVKIRDNESCVESLPITVFTRVSCHEKRSYIVVGGLGGFGLELADWLVLRGCTKLILNSRRGTTNGYQKSRIRIWQSYGVEVKVSTSDVTTKSGCEKLIQEACELGSVGGIFNLAVALRDALFENQTKIMFKESLAPKALATKLLDELSRKLCPDLHLFVVFSSVSCGRGNAGQSNYGMANSIMERIVEQRHKIKFPAKAIQWGAVGDVGLLAELEEKSLNMQISGTLPQRISSCLDVLDVLLTTKDPIVASTVVAEKQYSDVKKDNIIELLCNILGIRDTKSISMDAPLSKLGMDSLMTIEIVQLLEREFNLVIPLKELQSMTLFELEKRTKRNIGESFDKPQDHVSKRIGLEWLLANIEPEVDNEETLLCLKNDGQRMCKALIVPGIEGRATSALIEMFSKLSMKTFVLQFNKTHAANSLKEIHDGVIHDILKLFSKEEHFLLIGYSFGTLLCLEIAKTLETSGLRGNVVMVDGSPEFFVKFKEEIGTAGMREDLMQNEILTTLFRIDFPGDNEAALENILSEADWDLKLDQFVGFQVNTKNSTKPYSKNLLTALLRRIEIIQNIENVEFPKLHKSKISLIKPSLRLVNEIDETYSLNDFCSNDIETVEIKGNHVSMLNNDELANFINKRF